MRLWHKYALKHHIETSRVSVPMFDPGAKGLLHKCECGKVWAQ